MEYKVSIDYNLKMPRLIIFIDKDPQAIWDDLQRNGKVNSPATLALSCVDCLNRITIGTVECILWSFFKRSIEHIKKNGCQEWGPFFFFFFAERTTKRTFASFSTYCHILQYNEDEIKTLDDVRSGFSIEFTRQLIFLQVLFDIEQLNFDDTNKFPDWRVTVDVELEKFRAQWVTVMIESLDRVSVDGRLQDEHFWTRMFNVNRLLHLSEWWTEPNAQKTQLGLMKNVSYSSLSLRAMTSWLMRF